MTDAPLDDTDEPDSIGLVLVRRLLRYRCLVTVIWAVIFGVSWPLAFFTVHQTESRYAPPIKDTLSEHGLALMQEQFPDQADEGNEVVMVTCANCKSVLNETFTQRALQRLAAKMEELEAANSQSVSNWDRATAAADAGARLQDAADTLGIAPPGNPYVSDDERTVMYRTVWSYTDEMSRVLRDFMRFVDELDREGGSAGFRVYIFGPMSMSIGLNAELLREMMYKESCVIPFTIAVLIYQVRSIRLTLLSGLTLAVSIVVSLGVLFFVKMSITLVPTCPLLVMTLCVALSVDYSLFIFARFREELQHGRTVQKALGIAMDCSGRVIALSGSILVCSAAMNTVFPGQVVRCMAITNALSVCVIILVHTTLTPCVIALFPAFFSYGLSGSNDPRGSIRWFKWGSFLTTGWCPLVVMAVIYSCMIPAILRVFSYTPSTDIGLQIPHGSASYGAYDLAQASIPQGEMWPIFLINAHGDIQSDEAFSRGCHEIHRLVDLTKGKDYELGPSDFYSPFTPSGETAELLKHLPGNCPPLTCLQWTRPPPECPFLPSAKQLMEGSALNTALLPGIDEGYRELWRQHVNSANTSVLIRITARFDQTGRLMTGLYDALKRSRADAVYGSTVSIHEISMRCYHRWGLVLALNLVVMSIFIGFAFRTLLVPLKLFLTVVVPLSFVYGALVAIYQDGILNWTHIMGFESVGIFWVTPIITLPLHLGLAVDYDVFIFARVVELRSEGYSNRAAVVGALATTGPPITSAGLIMTFAFSGMLLSRVVSNCQVGLVISLGILLDSFVVRGVLVPCVLCLGNRVNYWPVEMPEETLTLEDMRVYLTEVAGSKRDMEK